MRNRRFLTPPTDVAPASGAATSGPVPPGSVGSLPDSPGDRGGGAPPVHAMRRAQARREVSARVRLSRPDGASHDGWALNVSGGGVRVILEANVELGGEYDVFVHDPVLEGTGHRARVVWIQEEPDGVVAGLEFVA